MNNEIAIKLQSRILKELDVELDLDENIFDSTIDSFSTLEIINMADDLSKENNLQLDLHSLFANDFLSLTLIEERFRESKTL